MLNKNIVTPDKKDLLLLSSHSYLFTLKETSPFIIVVKEFLHFHFTAVAAQGFPRRYGGGRGVPTTKVGHQRVKLCSHVRDFRPFYQNRSFLSNIVSMVTG